MRVRETQAYIYGSRILRRAVRVESGHRLCVRYVVSRLVPSRPSLQRVRKWENIIYAANAKQSSGTAVFILHALTPRASARIRHATSTVPLALRDRSAAPSPPPRIYVRRPSTVVGHLTPFIHQRSAVSTSVVALPPPSPQLAPRLSCAPPKRCGAPRSLSLSRRRARGARAPPATPPPPLFTPPPPCWPEPPAAPH